MVQARCERTVRWEIALTSAENSAMLFQTWDEGLHYWCRKLPTTETLAAEESKLPKKGWHIPIVQNIQTVRLQWLQGRVFSCSTPASLPQSFPSKFSESKMQLHLHPERLPSGNKHNICNPRKEDVSTAAKHYRTSTHFSSHSQATKLTYKQNQNFLFFLWQQPILLVIRKAAHHLIITV